MVGRALVLFLAAAWIASAPFLVGCGGERETTGADRPAASAAARTD